MKNAILILTFFILCTLYSQAQGIDSLWDQSRISNATVLLYQKITDTTAETGSGTIIGHDSRYFLLTASHVAKEMKSDSKLILHLDGDKPGIVDLVPITKDKNLAWITHPVADISFIELSPREGEVKDRITKCAFPIHQIYSRKDLPQHEADLTFLGFPVMDLEMEYFSPLIFTGDLSSGLITQHRYDTKTKCNFFFLNVPSIQGCSGSGVYYSVKKAMYFGSSVTLMIGIMHGTQSDNTGGKMAAVTPAYYIYDLFK